MVTKKEEKNRNKCKFYFENYNDCLNLSYQKSLYETFLHGFPMIYETLPCLNASQLKCIYVTMYTQMKKKYPEYQFECDTIKYEILLSNSEFASGEYYNFYKTSSSFNITQTEFEIDLSDMFKHFYSSPE